LTSSLPHGTDIRTGGAGSAVRIGVWLHPAADAAEGAAREEALASFPFPSSFPSQRETWSAFVNAELIGRPAQAAGAWSLQGAVVPYEKDSPGKSPGLALLRWLPAEILIPGGLKIKIDYRRLTVRTEGLAVGGSWTLAERLPSVTVAQPARISAEFPDQTCMTQLRVRTADLLPPLRQVRWSANGLVANPGARSTPVVFDVQGARPGQVLSKNVAVRVVDADGLTAEAQVAVPIQVTWDAMPQPQSRA
jgi:hypothetical protein